ncbi:MAG: efflux RND transporter permease subunit [Acidobacteriota bacterium]
MQSTDLNLSPESPQPLPYRGPALIRFAVERRVTMAMAVLGLVVLGIVSLNRLPLEFLPAFYSSSITVTVPYPSSSPREIEREILRPLEDAFGTLQGLDTLTTSASADSGRARLSFIDGTDMDFAAVEVRDRLDRARTRLPADVENISLRRFQSTDIPVLRFQITAPWPAERLHRYSDEILQRRLERLEGVAQVSISGLRTPQVQIRIDPQRLEAHGQDLRVVAATLRNNHLNLPGGEIRENSRLWQVRSVGELRTLDEIRTLPLDGSGLRLRDIADVEYAFSEQESFNFLNGREALTVSINKTSTANLLEVVDRVKAELDLLRQEPAAEGLQLHIYSDSSLDVRKGLGQLRDAGLLGGVLAILAVFFFLRRLRTTLLVAIAIPVSVVATFVLLYLLREAGAVTTTLNIVSLTGLMLALGMLVDNSIVVIESIFRHRNEHGVEARRAAVEGTAEVALPITASTATTVCVFLPLIFLAEGGGRFARFMNDIGVTIIIVSVAAWLISLTVVPMTAALLLSNRGTSPAKALGPLGDLYVASLRLTLRFRLVFVVLMVVLLAWSWNLFSGIDRTFSSRSAERSVTVFVDTPRQYTVEQTRALHEEVYELLDSRRQELDIADISNSYSRTGGRSRGGWQRTRRFEIYLVDEEEGQLTTFEARDRIRELLPVKAGVNLRIAQSAGLGGGGGGIEVELSSDDAAVLQLLASRVVDALAQIPGVRDVDTSLESGAEEIRVSAQRERSLQSGLSTQDVANTVSRALSSRPVGRIQTADREVDMMLQYEDESRRTLDQLQRMAVPIGAGRSVPLGSVADFTLEPGPESIEREDRRPQIEITANISDPSASFAALRAAGQVMGSLPLPPGTEWSFGRWARRAQQDAGESNFALLFAVVIIYMLMAALFESFLQPLVIMFAIPFSVIGVGLVMKLAGQPRDNMTDLGLVILVGLVVNNAIVLLDHINRLRRQGLSRTDAILLGGRHRLRPILMTAVTTIFGLLPMVAPFFLPEVFGTIEGRAATWAPVGLVILGGLTTSTFLTLMIIPTVYSLVDDLSRFGRRVLRAA